MPLPPRARTTSAYTLTLAHFRLHHIVTPGTALPSVVSRGDVNALGNQRIARVPQAHTTTVASVASSPGRRGSRRRAGPEPASSISSANGPERRVSLSTRAAQSGRTAGTRVQGGRRLGWAATIKVGAPCGAARSKPHGVRNQGTATGLREERRRNRMSSIGRTPHTSNSIQDLAGNPAHLRWRDPARWPVCLAIRGRSALPVDGQTFNYGANRAHASP